MFTFNEIVIDTWCLLWEIFKKSLKINLLVGLLWLIYLFSFSWSSWRITKKNFPLFFCPPLSKYSMSIQFSCRALTHTHESKNVLVSLPFLNQEKDAKIHWKIRVARNLDLSLFVQKMIPIESTIYISLIKTQATKVIGYRKITPCFWRKYLLRLIPTIAVPWMTYFGQHPALKINTFTSMC